MEIFIKDKAGHMVSLEEHLHNMEDAIVSAQATIVRLDYQLKTQTPQEPKEAPKSDYDKLKEEIIEEVNLIISDLL
jgi:hypothetical protein